MSEKKTAELALLKNALKKRHQASQKMIKPGKNTLHHDGTSR